MPTNVRTNVFETNSSSTHTLVVPHYTRGLMDNEVAIPFPAKMFQFGRWQGIWTDAPHKFAYIWQGLCSQLEFVDHPFIDKESKIGKSINWLKTKVFKIKESDEYKIPKNILERFDNFKKLLEMVSENLAKHTKIKLDFSDLDIWISDDENIYQLASKSESFVDTPYLDPGIESRFKIKKCVESINKLLDSKIMKFYKEEIDMDGKHQRLTEDGANIMECFGEILEFAFDERGIIISHGEAMEDEENEFTKTIMEYVSKNKGSCNIVSLEAH